MKAISLNLRKFINDVYGIDYEKVLDYDYFNFDNLSVQLDEDELEEAKNLIFSNFSDKDLGDEIIEKINDTELFQTVVTNSKLINYENTYMSEYFEEFKKQIEKKIIKDIENIQKMLSDELNDFNIHGNFSCKINWEKDEIIFYGKIKALEAIIVEVCNAYGLFIYGSLKEFKEVNGGSIKDRIESHMSWLKSTEDIYGTIYNLFKFNSEFIDYYGSMGSYDLDLDTLIEELEVA